MKHPIPPLIKGMLAYSLLASLFVPIAMQSGCSPVETSKSTSFPPAKPAYAAVARGRVDVEGGLIKLAASRDGLVTQVSVKEGDYVKKGELLAVLDERPVLLAQDLARKEVAQASSVIEAIRVKLRAAQREAGRMESLHKQGAIPRVNRDQAHDQVEILKAEVRQAEEARAAAQTRLNIQDQELEQHRIRAPKDGQVVRCQVRPGDGVSTLTVTPLFLFAPDAPRIVKAELEEPFLWAVAVGQPAEITADSDANRVIKGMVTRIGQVLNPKGSTDDPTQKADVNVAGLIVSLDDQALLIGQRVLVRILPKPQN